MLKFFKINNSIFDAENVVAIHERTEIETVEVQVKRLIATVVVNDNDGVTSHCVELPEGKQLSDYLTADQLYL